jgi:hypothetical protein
MRFFLQVTALSMMLLVGIFLGIDSAERNIQEMEGSEGAPRAIHITPENGRVEIAVMGQVYDAEPPVDPPESEQVKEEVQQAASTGKNLLGQVGNQVGQGIRLGTRKALELVVGWLEPGE